MTVDFPRSLTFALGERVVALDPLNEDFEANLNVAIRLIRAWAILVRADSDAPPNIPLSRD